MTKAYTYANAWHKPSSSYSPAFYETDIEPMIYKGVQVFFYADRADFVKDGVAVMQRASKTAKSAMAWIDSVRKGRDLLVAKDFTRRPL